MSRRTVQLEQILRSRKFVAKLNSRDRSALRDMLDRAYRAGQWESQQAASKELQGGAR